MNLQVYEEAGDWIVKHRDGGLDAVERQAFDVWLRQSPLHVSAYLEMSSLWEGLAELDPAWNPDAGTLLARADADAGVVPLVATGRWSGSVPQRGGSRPSGQEKPRSRWAWARRLAGPVGAVAACLLVAGASLTWLHLRPEMYSTGVGEQRSLVLSDGSTVALNARSRVQVRYTEDQRSIELIEGQALFHVAKNPQRPFVVQAGDAQVRAVGTAFDVRKGGAGTVVTVVEGRVAVHASRALAEALDSRLRDEGGGVEVSGGRESGGAGPTRPQPPMAPLVPTAPLRGQQVRGQPGPGEVLLDPGEQVLVTPVAISDPRQANLVATLAWTRRSLVLATVPLPEVAEELNRYSQRPLVIEDPTLANFNVSGVFSTADTTLLLQFLRAQPELAVDETPSEIRVRRR